MEHRTPIIDVCIQFTAYSVTSATLVRGSCVETSGSAVPLLNPYNAYWLSLDPEITFPNYLTSIPSFSAFINSKSSQLKTWLGYEMCTATFQSPPVVPNLSPSSSTALPSATKAESSASARHTHTTHIIILSVITPIVGLAIPLLCFIAIRRYREKKGIQCLLGRREIEGGTNTEEGGMSLRYLRRRWPATFDSMEEARSSWDH